MLNSTSELRTFFISCWRNDPNPYQLQLRIRECEAQKSCGSYRSESGTLQKCEVFFTFWFHGLMQVIIGSLHTVQNQIIYQPNSWICKKRFSLVNEKLSTVLRTNYCGSSQEGEKWEKLKNLILAKRWYKQNSASNISTDLFKSLLNLY